MPREIKLWMLAIRRNSKQGQFKFFMSSSPLLHAPQFISYGSANVFSKCKTPRAVELDMKPHTVRRPFQARLEKSSKK